MNGLAKLAGFMTVAAMLTATAPLAIAANAQEVYIQENFDSLDLINDGTAAGEVDYGDFYLDWAQKQPISAADISQPEKKFAGSSLSAVGGPKDKALKINIQSGSSANSYFRTMVNKQENMYEKQKLRFAFNVNIPNANSASYAAIQVDFRSGKTVKNLIGFRGNKAIQIFNDASGVNLDEKYQNGSWYYVVFDFDTQAKTYDLYINGENKKTDFPFAGGVLAFPGEFSDDVQAQAAGKYIIDQIRFSVNNGSNCTGANVLIDDIYFGEVPQEPEPDFAAVKPVFTNGSEEITDCDVKDTVIHAQTQITYPKETENQDVTLMGALYEKNALKKVWMMKEDFSNRSVSGSQTMDLVMDAMELNGDCWIKTYVWNGTTKPMTEAGVMPVKDSNYLYYQNYFYLNSGDPLPGVTTVNSPISAQVGGDLEKGREGLMAKIQIAKTGNGSYPYVNYNTGVLTEPFVVEYDMRMADEVATCARKLGFRDENSGSTVLLLNYRPTGKIQNGAEKEIGKYSNWAWTNYKLEIDPVNGTFKCYINGEETEGGTFAENTRLNALRLTFENSKGNDEKPCTTYIDNMRIYKAQ